jgi:hypothetical protein
MYVNASGKENMAIQLSQNIKATLVKHKELPVMLKWNESQVNLNQAEIKENFADGKNSVTISKEVRASKRQKRNIMNKIKIFL